MPRKIICPACRALGSTTDCVERIGHATRQDPEVPVRVSAYDEPEYADLEVVLRFPVNVEIDGESLMSKAQALRDRLVDNPREIADVFWESADDCEVQVLTPTEHV